MQFDIDNPNHKSVTPNNEDFFRGVSARGIKINDTADYIINELLFYDYSDDVHKEILFMKLKVLDGSPDPFDTREMGETTQAVIDALPVGDGRRTFTVTEILNTSCTNPVQRETKLYLEVDSYASNGDHWSELQNELVFLDRYVRTKEGTLNPGEPDFDTLVEQRIDLAANSVKRGLKLFQIPQSRRPTKMSSARFDAIYQKIKTVPTSAEFLADPRRITSDIISSPIDNDVLGGIRSLNGVKLPCELKTDASDTAEEFALPPDNTSVSTMNEALSGLWVEYNDVYQNTFGAITSATSTVVTGFAPTNIKTTHNEFFYGIHIPHVRDTIDLDATDKNNPTFRGNNFVSVSGDPTKPAEGYIFEYWRNPNTLQFPTSGDLVDKGLNQGRSFRIGDTPVLTGGMQTSSLTGPFIPNWDWTIDLPPPEFEDREAFADQSQLIRVDVETFVDVDIGVGPTITVNSATVSQTETRVTSGEITDAGRNNIDIWDTTNYLRENMVRNFLKEEFFGVGSRFQIESLLGLPEVSLPLLDDSTKGAIAARKFTKTNFIFRINENGL